MIPRSWNDFGAQAFVATPTALVDDVAGDELNGCGESSSADSGVVGFVCVGAVCLALFDELPSSLCVMPPAFRFLTEDMSAGKYEGLIVFYEECVWDANT